MPLPRWRGAAQKLIGRRTFLVCNPRVRDRGHKEQRLASRQIVAFERGDIAARLLNLRYPIANAGLIAVQETQRSCRLRGTTLALLLLDRLAIAIRARAVYCFPGLPCRLSPGNRVRLHVIRPCPYGSPESGQRPSPGPLEMLNDLPYIPDGARLSRSEGRMVGILPVRGMRQ
jgi:hypothetical protein